MKGAGVVAALLLAVLLAGCSSVVVKSDFDPAASFSQYKTFDFFTRPNNRLGTTLHQKRIEAAVEQTLTMQGFQKQTAGKPDILIAYHTNVRDKIDVDTFGYRYGRYGRRIGTYTTVREFQQGTLVLDFVDAQSNELVWRGWAMGEVNDSVSKEKIDDTIAKILSKYPPQ